MMNQALKWFKPNLTKDELKHEYRKLMLIHHPDKGGRTEDAQEINAEYNLYYTSVMTLNYTNNSTPQEYNQNIEEMLILLMLRDRYSNANVFYSKSYCSEYITDPYKTYDLKYKPGFYVCTPVIHKTLWHNIVELTEPIHDSNISNEDLLALIRNGIINKDLRNPIYNQICGGFNCNVRDSIFDWMIEIWKTQFGDIMVFDNQRYPNRQVALFKYNDEILPCHFILKQLGPYTIEDSISLIDFITVQMFGEYAGMLEFDYTIPKIMRDFGVTNKDKLKEYWKDPTIEHYMNSGVISIYHKYKFNNSCQRIGDSGVYTGHFNLSELVTAIVKAEIDLEDINYIQDWFDNQYNEGCKIVKSMVKHGKITLK